MSVARLPANVDVATSVGRYQAHYKIENGAIDVRRDLVIGQQVVAPAAYPDLERLIQVSLLDSQATIVLTRAGQ